MTAPLDTRARTALLRIGHPETVRAVERAMRAAGGAITTAAEALDVSEATLHRWLELPALARASALRMGLDGAAEAGREALRRQRADRSSSNGAGARGRRRKGAP